MPYRNKEKEKTKKHELYLKERQLIKSAKIAAGIPLDRRIKKYCCKRCSETFSDYRKFRLHTELHVWDNYDSKTIKNVTITSSDIIGEENKQ
jgi:hypothetical protein